MSKLAALYLYRLSTKNTVFMLCDIQEKFRPHIPLMNAVIQNTQKLVAAGKVFNIPLLVTEQYPKGLGPTVCELDISHACANISKTKFSMIVPKMKHKFEEIFGGKPKTAILFGLEAHVCIEQTAFDLMNNQVNVWMVADCCASRLNQDRDMALQRLRDIGCIVTTSESVIFNLLGDKNHKKFKAIAPLVKQQSADVQFWRPTKTKKS